MRGSRDLHNIHNITGFKFNLHVKRHDETHVLVITHDVHYICIIGTYRFIPKPGTYRYYNI